MYQSFITKNLYISDIKIKANARERVDERKAEILCTNYNILKIQNSVASENMKAVELAIYKDAIAKECISKGDFYKSSIVIDPSEIVNGYQLYSVATQAFTKRHFDELIDIWLTEIKSNDMIRQKFTLASSQKILQFLHSFSEFKKSLNMCTDWNRMDDHGEFFAGFWNFPAGSIEYDNAYIMTERKNILCLFKLPYPIAILKATTRFGCGNRMESVRYSNFLCEWLARKYQILNNKPLPKRTPFFSSKFDEYRYIYTGDDDSDNDNSGYLLR